MKNLFSIALFFGFALLLNSCSQEEKTSPEKQQVDLSKLDIKVKSLIDPSILFEYIDAEELRTKGEPAFVDLIKGSFDELDSRTDITQIISVVGVKDGKATVKEIHFIDLDNDRTIERHILDEGTGLYVIDTNIEGSMSNGNETAPCPSGFTLIKSCTNNRDTLPGCIGGAVQQYLTSNLTQTGDCVEVQVKVTLSGTKICGKTC